MPRTRRVVAGLTVVVAFAAAGVVGWDLLQLSRRPPVQLPPEERATAVLIEKGARRMSLMKGGSVYKVYAISLGDDAVGHKQQEGDGRTPEGMRAILRARVGDAQRGAACHLAGTS